MSKKSKELLEWEKKLKKEEEMLAKSKRNLNERKQKLSEAERKLKKKKKELEDIQKNVDVARMNLDRKENEVNALAKKLRDAAKVENNQELLKEDGDNNVFDVKNQEFKVKLNERVRSSEPKGLKKNNATVITSLEKKKSQLGSEKGNVVDEGVDDEFGFFTKPPKTIVLADYFPRHTLERRR